MRGGTTYGGGAVRRVIRAPRRTRRPPRPAIVLAGLIAATLATASCSAADQRAVVDPRPSQAAGVAVPTTTATAPATVPTPAQAPGRTPGARVDSQPAGSTTRGGGATGTATPPTGAHSTTTERSRPAAGPRPSVVPQHQVAPTPSPSQDPGPPRGTYLIECVEDNLTQEPTSFTLACGDANEALDKLRWERWGSPRATADGVLFLNTCEPSCAAGTLERFTVSVAASKPVKHGTGQVYTLLTVRFVGKLPKGYQRVERYPLPS